MARRLSAAPSATEAARDAIERELLVDMFRRSRWSLPTFLLIVGILCVTVRGVLAVDPVARMSVYVAIGLVFPRFVLLVLPERAWPVRGGLRLRFVTFLLGAVLNSLAVAVLNFRVYRLSGITEACVLVVLNAGIIAGALVSMSSSPLTYFAYFAPTAGSLMWLLVTDPRPWPGGLIALGWALWLVFLTLQTFDYRRSRRQLLSLNYDLDVRVDQLETARSEAERGNRELAQANAQLVASNARANRIFSALAEALPGRVLDGKVQLEERIGEGGFAVVFRGTHLALRRPVAVKIFRPRSGNDSAESLERFRLEGIAVSRLQHPNIVLVHDSGITHDGIAYIVMELLEGVPLSVELERIGSFPLDRAAEVVRAVCEALAAAHATSIVHRDIKAENVFLHQGPQVEVVKLVDFGVAKSSDLNGLQSHRLTRAGALVGTPAYMAPERFRGVECDESADVYAVGVLAYHMLSKRFPYEGAVSEIMVEALTVDAPKLHGVEPRVPVAVSDLVARALSRDPRGRPTAAELGRDFFAVVAALLPREPAAATDRL